MKAKPIQVTSPAPPKRCQSRAAWTTAVLLVMGLGALLRVLYTWREPSHSRDGLLYLNDHNHWLAAGVSGKSSPILSRLFELGDRLFGDPVLFVRGINIFFGVMLIGVVFGLAMTVWKRFFPALAAALLIAVNYTLIRNCNELQRESGYLLCWGLALWSACLGGVESIAGVRWRRYAVWAAGGFLAALGLMFRFESFEIPLIAGALILLFPWAHRLSWRERIWGLGVFVASWILSLPLLSFCCSRSSVWIFVQIFERVGFYSRNSGVF